MRFLPTVILPKHNLVVRSRDLQDINRLPDLLDVSGLDPEKVFERFGTSAAGLSESEAVARLAKYGPNLIVADPTADFWHRLRRALPNSTFFLLLLVSGAAWAAGNLIAGLFAAAFAVAQFALRWVRDARADAVLERIRAITAATTTVVRDNQAREVYSAQLVPGDLVRLSAGELVPADLRLVGCRDFFVIQTDLMEEPFPVRKVSAAEPPARHSLLDQRNLCFMGASAASGAATAVVVETGMATYLGGMAEWLTVAPEPTPFELDLRRLCRVVLACVGLAIPCMILGNGFDPCGWVEAVLFALAVGSGMAPELYQSLVRWSLARSAATLADRKIFVKQLESIRNLGAIDTLCIDKTDVLTQNRVLLKACCDVTRQSDDDVLMFSYLNAYFHSGNKNVIDRAILDQPGLYEEFGVVAYQKLDELPMGFARRCLSVVVETPDGERQLICKGAPESVLRRCTQFVLDGTRHAIDPLMLGDLREVYEQLSSEGFRVLAVAYRHLDVAPPYSPDQETDLTLVGFIGFIDPPRDSAVGALASLAESGVVVKVFTGDDAGVSRKICAEVGISVGRVLQGSEVKALTDDELGKAAEETALFARLSQSDQQRVVRSLQANGHVVGFLGDGIDDLSAIRAADVSISDAFAPDVVREAADVLIHAKKLDLVSQSIVESRRAFQSILRQIRIGTATQLGTLFAAVGASVLLPFAPMTALQILVVKFLIGLAAVPSTNDPVDAERIAKPQSWRGRGLIGWVATFALCSTAFDALVFLFLYFVFGCRDANRAEFFQTGWFVASILGAMATATILRTDRVPFLASRPGWPLRAATVTVAVLGIWLPWAEVFGESLGLVLLPHAYWSALGLALFTYVMLTENVKLWRPRAK